MNRLSPLSWLWAPALACLFGACQNKVASNKQNPANATLVCNTLRSPDTDDMPLTAVVVKAFGDSYAVDTVSVCQALNPEEYAQYGIPDTAISAAGGWWAGSGDYFFLSLSPEGDVLVYQGWQDEGQSDEGFHYKPVVRIKPIAQK